jgi:hypothetical protein
LAGATAVERRLGVALPGAEQHQRRRAPEDLEVGNAGALKKPR